MKKESALKAVLGMLLSLALVICVLPAVSSLAEEIDTTIYVGDVDGSGKIDAKDVTVLRRYLAGGWGVQLNEADADLDLSKKVDAKDVTLLRRYLAGGWGVQLPKKPAQEPVYTGDINPDTFPDYNFRQYVLDEIDKDGDGSLSEEELAVEVITVNGYDIANLTGIERFTKLQQLDCSWNNLKTLDLSQNTDLVLLNCEKNLISSLNLSQNTSLIVLDCSGNNLGSLDLSANTMLLGIDCGENFIINLKLPDEERLIELRCSSNQISGLDLSSYTYLGNLECQENCLTELDVSSNSNLESLNCSYNDISELNLANNTALGTLNCKNNSILDLDLRKNTMLSSLFCDDNVNVIRNVLIDEENFPDEVFREFLKTKVDKNGDNYLSDAEIEAVTDVDLSNTEFIDSEEIKVFKNLASLNLSNTKITSFKASECKYKKLDLSNNPNLTFVYCWDAGVEEVSLSNSALTYLNLAYNRLKTLDLGKVTGLNTLFVYANMLEELDVSKLTGLQTLSCEKNKIQELDLRNNTILETLVCDDTVNILRNVLIDENAFNDEEFRKYVKNTFDLNKDNYLDTDEINAVKEIDISNKEVYSLSGIQLFKNLEKLNCSGTKISEIGSVSSNLKELDISYTANLQSFKWTYGELASLKVKGSAIRSLTCYWNKLTELDAGELPNITYIDVTSNLINSIKVDGDGSLTELHCDDNYLSSIDLSDCTALTILDCNDNNLTGLDLSANTELEYLDCRNNEMSGDLDLRKNIKLGTILCDFSVKVLRNLKISEAVFPDPVFREYVSSAKVDSDGDGYLSETEMAAVREIDLRNTELKSLEGLELFKYLDKLDCSYTKLAQLELNGSTCRKLYLDGTSELIYLNCFCSGVEELSVIDSAVVHLSMNSNFLLSSIDVSTLKNLQILDISYCDLEAIDVSGLTDLQELFVDHNELTELNVKTNVNLKTLYCENNNLTVLDLRYNNKLDNFTCDENVTVLRNIRINTKFKDVAFRNYVQEIIDKNNDGYLDNDEVANVKEIDLSGLDVYAVDGIEIFKNLEKLNLSGTKITGVDFDRLRNLKELDVSGTKELKNLNCSYEGLTSLKVAGSAIVNLTCGNNSFTELDASGMSKLEMLFCESNSNLTDLKLSGCTALKELYISYTGMKSVDLSGCTALTKLVCIYGGLTSLDLSSNIELNYLDCRGSYITELDLRNNNKLETLDYSSGVKVRRNIKIAVPNFEDELLIEYIKENFDTDKDGFISDEEAAAVTEINLSKIGVTSVKGIEIFVNAEKINLSGTKITGFNAYPFMKLKELDVSDTENLVQLDCYNGVLTGLNVSNSAVKYLDCSDNEFTALDLSGADKLETLDCTDNEHLTVLNLSGCSALKEVLCSSCDLETIDLSNCSSLEKLSCSNNKLSEIDLSDSVELKYLSCGSNNLEELNLVNNTKLETLECMNNSITELDLRNNIWVDNPRTDYGVKVLKTIRIDAAKFEDELFRNYIKEQIDTDHNGGLSDEEIEAATSIDLSNTDVVSMKGITIFKNLEKLNLSGTKVTKLNLVGTSVKELDISNTTCLGEVNCNNVGLTSLKAANSSVACLECRHSYFDELDLSGCSELKKIYCDSNSNLKKLVLTGCTSLEYLSCTNNAYESLDLSPATELKTLYCYNNQLKNLNLSNNTELVTLYCSNNRFESLDFSNNTKLELLDCSGNSLKSLNLGKNAALVTLDCSFNELESLDLSGNPDLETITCNYNKLTELDLSANYKIKSPSYDYGITLYTNLPIDETNFEDEVFRNYIKENLDKDQNGLLSNAEIDEITEIDISGLEVCSLKGINNFKKLKKLNFSGTKVTEFSNGYLSLDEIDASNTKELVTFNYSFKSLDSLIISGSSVQKIYCQSNYINELDVSGLNNLEELYCGSNGMEVLNVSGCTALKKLDCQYNTIKSLDLKDNASLTYLDCNINGLTTLDVSNNPELNYLDCRGNSPLTELDLQNNEKLLEGLLYCNSSVNIIRSYKIDSSNFEDEVFREYLKSEIDKDNDDVLSVAEVEAVTEMDLSNLEISSIQGINIFRKLEKLNCSGTKIVSAYEDYHFVGVPLKELDLSNTEYLVSFDCSDMGLEVLKISNSPLTYMNCMNNNFKELDVSTLTKLETLKCYNNALESLNVSGCTSLEYLNCSNNALTSLDLSGCPALSELYCESNQLSALDLTQNTELWALYCEDNKIKEMDFRKCVKLEYKYCDYDVYYFCDIDLVNDFYDEVLKDYISQEYDIDPKDGILTQEERDVVTEIDLSGMDIYNIYDLYMFRNLEKLNCSGTKIDYLETAYLSPKVKEIDVSNTENLKSLEVFSKGLTSLKVSGSAIENLICYDNNLTELDLSGMTKLTSVTCYNNQIESLNLSGTLELRNLSCYGNLITGLNLSDCESLEYLICYENNIEEITFGEVNYISSIACYDNAISSLDLSKLYSLDHLYCYNNNITTLDLTNNFDLCESNLKADPDVEITWWSYD